MSETINLYEAKTNLSALVERAAKGEEIIIAKAGAPKARLVPIVTPLKERKPAKSLKIVYISDSFDDPLPTDLQRAFDGEDE